MLGMREEVNRLDFSGTIAKIPENLQITLETFNPAGDVHDFAGGKFGKTLKKTLVTAVSWGIGENHVGGFAVFCHAFHEASGILAQELNVFAVIAASIFDGIRHSGFIQLDAQHLAAVIGGDDADGARAAVAVQHTVGLSETSQFNGCPVEDFRLNGIDLIERAGRDPERLPADTVLDIALAMEKDLLLTHGQGHGILADILHDGRDAGMRLQECSSEVLPCREGAFGRHKANEIFARVVALTDHDMTEQPLISVGVVGKNLE